MIPNGEGCHYLATKKLSALLRRVTSKHYSESHCLNCFHSFARGNNRASHKKVCENKIFSNVIMPSEDNKTLKFN